MPPGRKEWFYDPSDDYVIGPGRFDDKDSLLGGRTDKSNKEFWEEWSNPLHLWDYVPGTRIPKREWKGNKFWEHKKVVKRISEKEKFPTSEGKCPLCGNDLHLIVPFGIYPEFYGCNSFPNCNFKCSVKQYQRVVKEVPNGEPIEITNTMKASDARNLSNKNEKWKVIRRKIDIGIKRDAQEGNTSSTQFFYTDHDTKKVIESLRADGFKCTVKEEYDPRDNDNCYIYKVSW